MNMSANKLLEENERLKAFVQFVANDYVELSHDKIRWQRDDYIRRARKLLQEINSSKGD